MSLAEVWASRDDHPLATPKRKSCCGIVRLFGHSTSTYARPNLATSIDVSFRVSLIHRAPRLSHPVDKPLAPSQIVRVVGDLRGVEACEIEGWVEGEPGRGGGASFVQPAEVSERRAEMEMVLRRPSKRAHRHCRDRSAAPPKRRFARAQALPDRCPCYARPCRENRSRSSCWTLLRLSQRKPAPLPRS